MSVTIYHNPACGTSRNALELIRATGAEPEVVHYLETPPTRDELVSLMQRMAAEVSFVGAPQRPAGTEVRLRFVADPPAYRSGATA